MNTSAVTILSIGIISFIKRLRSGNKNQTPTELNQNFLDWFKASKAVDEDGKPLVLLHGTKASEPFSQFRTDMQGKGLTSMFFTNNEHIAPSYIGRSGLILPVYLSLQNPLVLDFSDQDPVYWNKIPFNGKKLKTDTIVRMALNDSSYDGVIFKNIIDLGPNPRALMSKSFRQKSKGLSRQQANKLLLSDIYAVFSPNQIKSIYNDGTWSTGTNNMYK